MFWVESICNNEQVIVKNIQYSKLDCPHYRDLSDGEA